MTFSYSGDPTNSNIDEVRYLIQDTNSSDNVLEDEEIQYHLDNNSNNLRAAIDAAETVATNFARKADRVDAEEVSANYREQADRFRNVAQWLEARKNEQGSGLKSLSTGTTLWNDSPDQQFSIGQFDNNEAF